MQRVKALLTGSLPTFLDVGSVFAGGQIREDNVLLQAMRHGMRVGAVGDDTWTQLFPPSSQAALNLSHPYPSLNVHDLDTVDDGISAVCLSSSPHLGTEYACSTGNLCSVSVLSQTHECWTSSTRLQLPALATDLA